MDDRQNRTKALIGNTLSRWTMMEWLSYTRSVADQRGKWAPFDVIFLSGGNKIASVNYGDGASIWDKRTGRVQATSSKRYCFGSNDVSRRTIIGHSANNRFIVAPCDGATVLSASTLHPICKSQVHDYNLSSISVSPNGRYFVSTSEASSDHRNVILRDARTCKAIATLNNSGYTFSSAFTPDGRYVVFDLHAYRKNILKFWDMKTRTVTKEIQPANCEIRDFAFSKHGDRLVILCDKGNVELWNVKAQKRIRRFYIGTRATVRAMAYSADGNYLATATMKSLTKIDIWNVTGKSGIF